MGNDVNKKGLAAGITVAVLSIAGLFFTDGTLNTTLQVTAGFSAAISCMFVYFLTKIDPVELEAVQKAVVQQQRHIVSEAIQKDLVADDYYEIITVEFREDL